MDNATQANHQSECDVRRKLYTLLGAPKGNARNCYTDGSCLTQSHTDMKLLQYVPEYKGNCLYAVTS